MSTAMSQAKVAQAVNIQVLSMAMNQAQSQGQGLIQTLEKSSDPNLGNIIDISV